MSITNLKNWLKRPPVPSVVVADGKPVSVPSGPRKWAELQKTLESLDATTLQCMDAAGNVLRATTFEDDEEEEGASTVETDDAWAIRMAAMGAVMKDLAVEVARAVSSRDGVVIEALANMLNAQSSRAEANERAASELYVQLAKARAEAIESAAGGGDETGELLRSVLQGARLAKQEQAKKPAKPAAEKPTPEPNGKEQTT